MPCIHGLAVRGPAEESHWPHFIGEFGCAAHLIFRLYRQDLNRGGGKSKHLKFSLSRLDR
jgi:hypothetical protein